MYKRQHTHTPLTRGIVVYIGTSKRDDGKRDDLNAYTQMKKIDIGHNKDKRKQTLYIDTAELFLEINRTTKERQN